MSKFVYHRVPQQMEGITLYPLNQLKDMFPEAWEAGMKKYRDSRLAPHGKTDRLYLLERKVPLLDCLWNDVLHCLPIDPRLVYPVIRECGADDSYKGLKFYKIPVEKLGGSVYYKFNHRQATHEQMIQDTESLDVDKHLPYTEISQKTMAFYKEAFSQGRNPILWPHIPHVLVHAPIDIEGCEIIDWSV